MKDYTKRNAKYRAIPCWYNPLTDELKGKNWFYEILLWVVIWIDVNLVEVDEFPLWVEMDELEK